MLKTQFKPATLSLCLLTASATLLSSCANDTQKTPPDAILKARCKSDLTVSYDNLWAPVLYKVSNQVGERSDVRTYALDHNPEDFRKTYNYDLSHLNETYRILKLKKDKEGKLLQQFNYLLSATNAVAKHNAKMNSANTNESAFESIGLIDVTEKDCNNLTASLSIENLSLLSLQSSSSSGSIKLDDLFKSMKIESIDMDSIKLSKENALSPNMGIRVELARTYGGENELDVIERLEKTQKAQKGYAAKNRMNDDIAMAKRLAKESANQKISLHVSFGPKRVFTIVQVAGELQAFECEDTEQNVGLAPKQRILNTSECLKTIQKYKEDLQALR